MTKNKTIIKVTAVEHRINAAQRFFIFALKAKRLF